MNPVGHIDATVTVEWQDHRTIGTLVEMEGSTAVLTALRLPEIGAKIAFRIEGETDEDAVTVDGICIDIGDTAWGERRAELELLRVGTTCSASRLRDFIEQWSIARGGSVHIGQSSDASASRRFVYHIPDSTVVSRGEPHAKATPQDRVESALPVLDLPSEVIQRGSPLDPASRRVQTRTSPERGSPRAPRRTEPASPTQMRALAAAGLAVTDVDADFSDDPDLDFSTNPERTLNSEVSASFLTGGGLDAAFREALRSVEQPRIPARPTTVSALPSPLVPAISMDSPSSVFETGQLLYGSLDESDDAEPTAMMDAIADLDDDEVSAEAEASQLLAKVDSAIALERAYSARDSDGDSDTFDHDEPIIVNTVDASSPFADPVQLGNDNRAPSIGQVLAPNEDIELPAPRSIQSPTARGRTQTVAESLALPLRAPSPRNIPNLGALLDGDGPATGSPVDAMLSVPLGRESSPALRRISEVFSVDIAVRCDLPVQVQIGRKKHDGTLVRLAESKMRVTSMMPPEIYQRLTLLLPAPEGGKKPFAVQCEVVRVREREEEGTATAFDVRVVAGNHPREMNMLRAVIRSYHAPGAA